jgi:hypothetical protein
MARLIVCPVGGLLACFAAFVMMVNFSVTVANACFKVPVLRELAESVTFSKSLTKAVENDYVQTMNLVQTQNDITAKIEYLIVDQKQVNIFYRLTSEKYKGKYEKLIADPVINCNDELVRVHGIKNANEVRNELHKIIASKRKKTENSFRL